MSNSSSGAERPPFSRPAIIALVLAAVTLVIFGFLGIIAVSLGIAALRQIRAGVARGRALAIIAIALGVIDFVFWLINIAFHR